MRKIQHSIFALGLIFKLKVIGYLGTFGKNATKKFKDSLSFISQVPF
jgi:hypothetical protein